MAYVIADNIISPLGQTSGETYQAVKAGKSQIRVYPPGSHGIPEGFTASLMSGDFETIATTSASNAIAASGIDVGGERVAFILSTTKGPVEQLGQDRDESLYLGEIAQRMAGRLGIRSKAFVVCNACISGLSALILAERLLDMDRYDYAVVCGCDCPQRFIISGFQSLKALSAQPCHPFDMERSGLNLGEAAATMVLAKRPTAGEEADSRTWQISHGCVRNDAFHISAPSKTAEGLYKALTFTLTGTSKDDLALVNAHGTATLFNDQMESVAIQRAALSDVPANALKGYFGHTLGAAGILETILSMKGIEDHTISGTRGYEELGVSGKVDISPDNRPTSKHAFIKMLSGFGGCNATLLATETERQDQGEENDMHAGEPRIGHTTQTVHITPDGAWLNGEPLHTEETNNTTSLLTSLYKKYAGDYPKYYKMDGLCRLGFVASELLLQAEGKKRFTPCEDRAVVLFNHSSSISADRKYLESIQDENNYYPSPSVFVYTLPNIVTGEIAIRNLYHGETSFYILPGKDEQQMQEVMESTFMDKTTKSMLTGWIDYEDEQHFEAELRIVERQA